MITRKFACAFIAAQFVAAVFGTASAQTVIEEIVVTARKRAESLQEVPMAVTAFTSQDLARRAVTDMKDIARLTPGFSFQDYGGGGATAPVIRGASQITGNLEQNVSFFFDGVYLPRNYVTNLGFGNIERIEVVKGPQSARYGRNAFMGAINYVAKKPTEEWLLEGTGTVGNHSHYDGNVAVSGALVPDVFRFRAGIDYADSNGTWKNTHPYCNINFSQGTNCWLGGSTKKVYSIQGQLMPVDKITIDMSYYRYDYNEEHRAENFFAELGADSQILNCGQYNPNVRPLSAGGTGAGGQWYRLYCGAIPVRSIPIDPRGYARQLTMDFARASMNYKVTDALDVDYTFGHIRAFNKSFGYKDTLPGCTFFLPGLCVFENGPLGDFTTDSHEMRISWDNKGPITAAAGVFYTESEDYSTNNFSALPQLTSVPTQPVDVLDPTGFSVFAVLARTITKTKVWSPFGEVSYRFLDDRAKISFEGRFSRERKFQGSLATAATAGLNSFVGLQLRGTFKAFTPRFTGEYKLSQSSLLFASAAKGVKSGGFNATATLPENRLYGQDRNWTYELGSKNTFNDGKLLFNATLFYIHWTDLQITAPDTGNTAALPLSIIRNLGTLNSKGIELEGQVVPIDGLTLGATGYFGDARFAQGTRDLSWTRVPAVCDNVVCPLNGDVGGKQAPRQSKWQGTLSAEWSRDLGAWDAKYYLRADVAIQSRQYVNDMNISWINGRTIANASVGMTKEKYELQLWARNLFDKKYVQSVIEGIPNEQYNSYLGERLTFGLTAKFKY